uniref:Uncharacterized protein n=1 Tax=Tanacetum cinerariifolium TaxID=118510 RepID=A0A6L2N040_TANCI|nr:hypothetical protein [Tanacetum cinerariifolium]
MRESPQAKVPQQRHPKSVTFTYLLDTENRRRCIDTVSTLRGADPDIGGSSFSQNTGLTDPPSTYAHLDVPQITPNQPINPTTTTPSDNKAPSKAPAEESTPPTEEKTTLVQKEDQENKT